MDKALEPYRAMVAAMSEGAALLSRDGIILHCNSYLIELFQISREQLIGRRLHEMVAVREVEKLDSLLQEERREIGRDEIYFRRSDGTEFPALFSMCVTSQNCGDAISVVISDLTEVVAAAEARSRLALIVESSDDAILSAGFDCVITSWNRAAEQMFGYSAEEAIGHTTLSMIVPPERTDEIRQIVDAIRRGEHAIYPETVRRRKDGSNISVSVKASPIVDGNGETLGASISIRDITERKHAEDKLRLFRTVVDQSSDSIEVVDVATMRFVDVNEGACRALGYTREELLSMGIPDIDPEFRADPEKFLKPVMVQGHSLVESIHQRKDGSTFPVEVTIQTIELDRLYGLSIARDITERKKAADDIATYARQLEAAIYGTLQAVSNMVEQRDPYTAGHERRVGVIAADIGREMGWPEQKCKELEMIGLVHDIGKIGMPAELLSKPGRLTAIELEIVKAHAEKGYEILKDVEFPLPIAEIIYQHHERMDGSGYPRGLKGGQILPEARVLAVADVLESMASHRPYRPALGMEAALNELEGNRKRYDHAAVEALLRLARNGYQVPV